MLIKPFILQYDSKWFQTFYELETLHCDARLCIITNYQLDIYL
jgi:hypothetical protein